MPPLECIPVSPVGLPTTSLLQGGPVSEGLRRDLSREPMPTIIFHGDRDKTVHPINGDQVAVHSRAGAKMSTRSGAGRVLAVLAIRVRSILSVYNRAKAVAHSATILFVRGGLRASDASLRMDIPRLPRA
jgi:hypothetical protein